MAFVEEHEDVVSISLTAVNNLLRKNNISPKDVGRLEVGTETLIDKAKSAKTHLMALFSEHGNHDIEGVSTTNACYGGTNAIFNTLNWIESEAYDGRYGLVVSSDIAIHLNGTARPTGGAGAVAILMGPKAPLVLDPIRATYMAHEYDFYKPDPTSEFPNFDGHHSVDLYLNALRQCVLTWKKKQAKAGEKVLGAQDFDFLCFHTPFSKMVQKAYAHLILTDAQAEPHNYDPKLVAALKQEGWKAGGKTREIILRQNRSDWKARAEPSLTLPSRLGNLYTGSLYAGLLSLVANRDLDMRGKQILMFSYGSGCAASIFRVKVVGDYSKMQENCQFIDRLNSRITVSPEEFELILFKRIHQYSQANYKAQADTSRLFDGTFYLTHVDKLFRRAYACKGSQEGVSQALRRLNALTSQVTSANRLDKNVAKSISADFHKKTVKQRQQTLEQIAPQNCVQVDQRRANEYQNSVREAHFDACTLPVGLGAGVNGQVAFDSSPAQALAVKGGVSAASGRFQGDISTKIAVPRVQKAELANGEQRKA